ncbi:cellulase family glycosylhydrolase, partial [Parabacteroides sp. OttesenSCG-928-N08]|nr:cellulase family glycosylhydrolase [Parabacteroides sp. OttesenSCG-928-N08]
MNRNRCIHCLPGIIALLCLSLFACSSDNEEKPSITACKFLLDGEEINRLDFGEEKGSVTLYIVSPTDWKMETTVDWITLSRKTGLPSETGSSMMVHVALNSDIAERQGEIILKAADGEKRLTVTQQGGIDESGWEKASLAVRQMKTGWNLGNTLDPFSNNEEGHNWIELYTPAAPSDYETAWGQPITTPELMVMFKEKGFNAIRIPVTWFPHLDEKGQVKEEWMNRVEEVVNYVLDAGMYCVLNVHHDTGADPVTTWLMADMDKIDQIESKFASLWKQIAERFNRYDQKLLFESFNEMLDNH